MRNHSQRSVSLMLAAAFLLLAGCSVNVKKNDNGQDKKVDIDTPFGGIHVKNDADVRDTGLSVYPGARPKQKGDSDDEKSANVDISTSAFGLKVVAVEYETSDATSKVISFYKDQLKKYGKVLECHTSDKNYTDEGDSEELKCEGKNDGKTIELKSGTKSNQHIVAINPRDTDKDKGKGSDFALVYVRMRGKEGTI
ncbi:MAG: hypothetical protein JWN74_3717 [Acidobacteriaceae bacterium]|nr:hypothetical protein [Acidobacteriaceae bacterium]